MEQPGEVDQAYVPPPGPQRHVNFADVDDDRLDDFLNEPVQEELNYLARYDEPAQTPV